MRVVCTGLEKPKYHKSIRKQWLLCAFMPSIKKAWSHARQVPGPQGKVIKSKTQKVCLSKVGRVGSKTLGEACKLIKSLLSAGRQT